MPATARVALVDDHALVREGLERALREDSQIDVVWAGDDPLELLASGCAVDVVLLDLELNGKLVTVDIVTALVTTGTKVLIVTAHTRSPLIRELVFAGVHGLISKTESSASVIKAISRVNAGEYWTTRELAGALANAEPADVAALSDQERKALRLYASGLKIAVVATQMNVSPNTVKGYLKRARGKLALSGRPTSTQRDLYEEARRQGIIGD